VAIGVEPAQVRGIRPVVQRTARKQLLVVAALIEQEGRVLVAQRRADQARPLAWEFPGGKVEPGESPSQALVREIEEELACSIEVGAVVDVVFFAYDAFDLIMPCIAPRFARECLWPARSQPWPGWHAPNFPPWPSRQPMCLWLAAWPANPRTRENCRGSRARPVKTEVAARRVS